MNPSHPVSPRRASQLPDLVFGVLAKGAAWVTLGLLAGILLSLLLGAWPAIEKYGLGFLTRSVWDPVQQDYGGLVMIYGTLATSLIALLIAVPVSFWHCAVSYRDVAGVAQAPARHGD